MIDIILDILTYIVIAAQICGIIFGVVVFFLMATWMQVHDRKEKANGQEASEAQSGSADPAAKRRRRRTAAGDSQVLPPVLR